MKINHKVVISRADLIAYLKENLGASFIEKDLHITVEVDGGVSKEEVNEIAVEWTTER